MEAIDPAYMVLTYAEASSCHSNMQGITFGPKLSSTYPDMLEKNRSYGFS